MFEHVLGVPSNNIHCCSSLSLKGRAVSSLSPANPSGCSGQKQCRSTVDAITKHSFLVQTCYFSQLITTHSKLCLSNFSGKKGPQQAPSSQGYLSELGQSRISVPDFSIQQVREIDPQAFTHERRDSRVRRAIIICQQNCRLLSCHFWCFAEELMSEDKFWIPMFILSKFKVREPIQLKQTSTQQSTSRTQYEWMHKILAQIQQMSSSRLLTGNTAIE